MFRISRMEWSQKVLSLRGLFVISMLFMLVLPFSSKNIGSADVEIAHIDYANAIIDYYKTGGEDTTYKHPQRYEGLFRKESLKFKGGFFIVPWVLISRIFEDWRPADICHLMSALFGLICILFTGLITREVAGSWIPAIISIWLIFLTPYFFGLSLINNKDIPFAACMTMGTFFIIRIVKGLPVISYASLIGFALAMGMALGIRIGGLLLFCYAIAFIVAAYLLVPELRENYLKPRRWESIYKNISWLFLAGAVGFFFGILWYPHILSGPIIQRTLEVFQEASSFPTNIKQIFEGHTKGSFHYPWYYHIKYISITVPVIIWLLFLAFIPLYYCYGRKQIPIILVFILFFCTVFPEAYIIYKDSNVYGKWRHILFIYPTFVAISALSVHLLLVQSRVFVFKALILFALLFSLTKPAIWMIQNHPYAYVYSNMLIGWYENSYTKYPGDIYRLGTYDAMNWLFEHRIDTNKLDPDKPVVIASNDGYMVKYLVRNISGLNGLQTGFKGLCFQDCDYAIMSMTFLNERMRKTIYPPEETIHTINVDGVPVSAIVERSSQMKQGIRLFRKKKFREAYHIFSDLYKQTPNNYCLWFYLGRVLTELGQLEEAVTFLKRYKKYTPAILNVEAALGDAYFKQKKFKQARRAYRRLLQNKRFPQYKINFLIGLCNFHLKQYNKAAAFFKRALEYKDDFQPAQRMLQKAQKKKINLKKQN